VGSIAEGAPRPAPPSENGSGQVRSGAASTAHVNKNRIWHAKDYCLYPLIIYWSRIQGHLIHMVFYALLNSDCPSL
jgi:hypothetical protein